jgi:hypothetical protein
MLSRVSYAVHKELNPTTFARGGRAIDGDREFWPPGGRGRRGRCPWRSFWEVTERLLILLGFSHSQVRCRYRSELGSVMDRPSRTAIGN